jgi:Family of unknown function (DUF5519)
MTLERLRQELASIEGVVEARSSFADRRAWWTDGREIAHFDEDAVVDIRLTAPVIRARRSELAAHPEITFRRSSGADWVEVRVSSPEAQRLAIELVREAVVANRGNRQGRSSPAGS